MGKKELIKCPYCAEEIKKEARKCRYCGEWLEEKSEEDKKPVADGMQKAKFREDISNFVFLIYFVAGGLLGYYLVQIGRIEGYWIIPVTAFLVPIFASLLGYLPEALISLIALGISFWGGRFIWFELNEIAGVVAGIIMFIAISGTKELKETFEAYQ